MKGTMGWGVLLLLILATPAQARPQVLVVIADHLTLPDVTRPDLPGFARLRSQGAMALMSPGVAHPPDPVANVYATLGAGDSIAVGDLSQGRMDKALRAAAVRTCLIGDADGDDTGPYRPARLLLPTPDVTSDAAVPDPLAPGGLRTDPARLWAHTQAALGDSDLVIVHFGDFARLERENRQGDLLPGAYRAHRERALRALDQYLGLALSRLGTEQTLFVIVPTPPADTQGHWDRLTPVLRWPGGATLTSDTTQTVGLVAARDLAPTLLHLLRVPIPIQMTGAVIRLTGSGETLPRLLRLDRLTRLNQDAQNPLFWGIGLIAPALIFPLLIFYALGRLTPGSLLCRAAPYVLCLLASWPLALLLAPLGPARTLAAYLALIAALTALLALLPSPTLIFFLTACVLLLDGLTGTLLVSQSVLSSYALAGIRFYGIGNEYMGLLIGGGLLAAALAERPLTLSLTRSFLAGERVRRFCLMLGLLNPLPSEGEGRRLAAGVRVFWFALIVFVLSFPEFGAKAGGAVTATATFTLAWLRLHGVPLKARHFVFGIVAGFALVFLWAWLGDLLHLRRTHLETAVGAVQGGRFGYILGIARRKVGLAARVFLHPGTLLGVLALTIMAVAARAVFRDPLARFYSSRPRLAAVSEAGLWGSVLCVAFNDSGIVAAILLLMCLILPVLHGLVEEICVSSPSTSATSASGSPSAIRWNLPPTR